MFAICACVVYVCMPECMYVHHVRAVSMYSRSGITGSCELPDVVAKNGTQTFCKRSNYSALSQLHFVSQYYEMIHDFNNI